jgi:hypothetical protein
MKTIGLELPSRMLCPARWTPKSGRNEMSKPLTWRHLIGTYRTAIAAPNVPSLSYLVGSETAIHWTNGGSLGAKWY